MAANDQGVVEQKLTKDVADFLATRSMASYSIDHADLGYGFGAWSPEFLRAVGERGWIGITWPREVGGLALSRRALWAMLREFAYANAPAEAVFYSLAVGDCIVKCGTAKLREILLPDLVSGSTTFCEALSEPEAGSDLYALRTTVVNDGDDFILRGRKIWISNGAHADQALVLVRSERRSEGLSAFIVDLNLAGVERRAIGDITGEPSFSELTFDEVRVPGHCLIGSQGAGSRILAEALEWDRFWGRCVKAPFLRRQLSELWDAVTVVKEPDSGRANCSVKRTLAELRCEIEVCDAMFHSILDAYEFGAYSFSRRYRIGEAICRPHRPEVL